jgi:release factor glutamine methyltransferase
MMLTTTVAQSLQRAARALAAHSGSPQLDAEVLLCTVLGVARSALIVRGTEPLDDHARQAYDDLIERRADGVPVAYLTGIREFWSLPLKVTPAVLVPRPETELLVELALGLLPPGEARSVLDLGTGSGAIALAIASERARARVSGVDLSPQALSIARENSCALGLEVDWRLGYWFEAVPSERYDVIVANPPYVATGDPALESLASEPALALSSGPTGFEALEAIIDAAPHHLESGGWLLLEHGRDQHPRVARMLERRGFGAIASHHDFSDRPRVTAGTYSVCHKERS